ncbi:MAG: hypothetical protein ACJ72U_12605 [Nitrososphaeraceae archaeon]|jgi:hypothetical protein
MGVRFSTMEKDSIIVQEEHRSFSYTGYSLGFEISCCCDCHNGNSIVKAKQGKKGDSTSS